MRKLNNIDDMFVFRTANTNSPIEEFFVTSGDLAEYLKQSGIVAFPVNEPEKGLYGCVLVKQGRNDDGFFSPEKNFVFQNKVLEPISKIVDERSFEDFTKHFEEYKSRDIYIFEYDDVKTLRLGYVAVCGSGLVHHKVRLSIYKEWKSNQKNS